jgi:hypothetical protein
MEDPVESLSSNTTMPIAQEKPSVPKMEALTPEEKSQSNFPEEKNPTETVNHLGITQTVHVSSAVTSVSTLPKIPSEISLRRLETSQVSELPRVTMEEPVASVILSLALQQKLRKQLNL